MYFQFIEQLYRRETMAISTDVSSGRSGIVRKALGTVLYRTLIVKEETTRSVDRYLGSSCGNDSIG